MMKFAEDITVPQNTVGPVTDPDEYRSPITGKSYLVKFQDPYGMVKIVPKRGVLAEELTGMYTSKERAFIAIDRHESALMEKKASSGNK